MSADADGKVLMGKPKRNELPAYFWPYHKMMFAPFFDDKIEFQKLELIEFPYDEGSGDDGEENEDWGLQPDDYELFLSERHLRSAFFSTGRYLECYFAVRPEERKKSIAFKKAANIENLSDLLRYVEKMPRDGDKMAEDERAVWEMHFTSKEMQDIFEQCAMSDITVQSHVDRLLKIKKNLARMPYLDEKSRLGREGQLIAFDSLPGTLSARDVGLLRAIGLYVGIVVLRSGEDPRDLKILEHLAYISLPLSPASS